jgi:hypothetical protein
LNIASQKQLNEIKLQENREKLTPYREIRLNSFSGYMLNRLKLPKIRLYNDYLSFRYDEIIPEKRKFEICLQ